MLLGGEYKAKQVDTQSNEILKKRATANFVQQHLCHALFEHLKTPSALPERNMIEDYVFDFKDKNAALWAPEHIEALKEKLLAAHPKVLVAPVVPLQFAGAMEAQLEQGAPGIAARRGCVIS